MSGRPQRVSSGHPADGPHSSGCGVGFSQRGHRAGNFGRRGVPDYSTTDKLIR